MFAIMILCKVLETETAAQAVAAFSFMVRRPYAFGGDEVVFWRQLGKEVEGTVLVLALATVSPVGKKQRYYRVEHNKVL